MPSATQSHRTKRPFQPGIDSYFARVDRDEYLTSAAPPSEVDERSNLPATVQSNLLSVGMRVRKAVPEGYRTGKNTVDFSDDCPSPSGSMVSISSSRGNELQPFCGLHRTGGFGVQDVPVDAHMVLDDDPVVPGSSHDSTASSFSTISTNSSLRTVPPSIMVTPTKPKHKRRLDLELDDFDDDLDELDRLRSPSVSPRTSFPSSRAGMPELDLLTSNSVTSVMARPVARMKRRSNPNPGGAAAPGRRGAVDISAGLGTDDFGDADFLCEDDEWEESREVEMSGV